MKRMKSLALVLACAFLCISCGITTGMSGTTGNTASSATSSSSTGSYVMDMLGSLVGNYTPLKKTDLHGTWNYAGTDCKFKTENLLKQAGGEVAAKEIEAKLDETFNKLGIKKGACSFTFNADNTYSAVIGSQKLSGAYTYDETKKTLNLTYLMGLGQLEANVTRSSATGIGLLFDADRIMTLLNLLSSMSNNSTIKTINTLINEYDGLMLGFQLKK